MRQEARPTTLIEAPSLYSTNRRNTSRTSNAYKPRFTEQIAQSRLQLARMMDEQLVQSQAIETLRRQLETSNTATRDAQALLRMNQEQQPQNGRMPAPTALPALTPGVISNTPFVPPFATPATGLRTRELHGPGYCHVGSPADPGYAESMRAMFGRDEVDPPRRDPPTVGSSSQGFSSQHPPRTAWQAKAFPHFQAAGSFLPEELIPERLLIDVRSTLARLRSRSLRERLW